MNAISPLVSHAPACRPTPNPHRHAPAPRAAHRPHAHDAAEVIRVTPEAPRPLSAERLAEIRAQIAAGTYVTEHKLDVVVARLHAVLTATSPAPAEAGAA